MTKNTTHGGEREFDIVYTESTGTAGYNNWKLKSVLTSTKGSTAGATKTVYANHIGQDILVDLTKGGDQWVTHNKYNGDGLVTEQWNPTAVASYTVLGNSITVNAASRGLIRLTTYYTSTADDGAPGYVNLEKLKNLDGNTEVTLSKLTYQERTGASGEKVYPVKARTLYQSDSGDLSPTVTSYAYTWHGSTTQVHTVTTTLPTVDSTQNGGLWLTGNTRVDTFNQLGRLTESTDARGTKTTYEYDPVTGAMTKRTQDPGLTSMGYLNLVTEYEVDDLGRTKKEIGPEQNVEGNSTYTVRWTVYDDANHEVRSARGYRVGSSTYTIVGPVSITQMDDNGRVTDEIEAVLVDGNGDPVETKSGEFTEAIGFLQSQWCRWTKHLYGDDGMLEKTRVYFNIPSTNGDDGASNPNSHYSQTGYTYTSAGQQEMVTSPEGTITFTQYDPRGLVLGTWMGTDATGADQADPENGGQGGNNLKPLAKNTYDTSAYGSSASDSSKDGLLVKVTIPVDDTTSNDRETKYEYDWRNRSTDVLVVESASRSFLTQSTYDNLDRVTEVQESWQDSSNTELIGQQKTYYDDRGLVYRTERFGVNDADPPVAGNALTDNTWYDETGAVIKSHPAGSQAFTKTLYDDVGRPLETYTGYYDYPTGEDNPLNLVHNKIFEQTETVYVVKDAQNNHYTGSPGPVQVASLARYDDDTTSTGALVAGTSARPAYTAFYYDGIGRQTATAEYGNLGNDSTAFTRSATTPTRSDTILVTSTNYNARGEAVDQTDPKSQVSSSTYDDAGRMTKIVRNSGSTPTETTETAYTLSGQVKTLTAKSPAPPAGTGDQVTTYTYGVTTTNSKVASNDLLASVEYPGTGSNRTVSYEYNRQGQQIKLTDQNGSVHDYTYDKLGRQTEDVVAPGTNVDDTVKRMIWSYDNRRRLHKVTSDNNDDNQMTRVITNDIEYAYNDFNQVATEYQQHGSAVNTGTSPKVQYAYANGSTNTIRRNSVTYPSGEVLSYTYSAGADDKLSRVGKLSWDSTEVVDYAYLGLSQVVIQKYTEPANDVEYTLDHGTANAYAGMDRFGRIVDLQWLQNTNERVRLKYGYDRASNREYRRDEVARTNSAKFDELYAYDGLNRLDDFDRGELNANNNGFVGLTTLGQTWTLDETGNWKAFTQTVTGALTQTRTHNTVNEITDIDETQGTSWPTPVYDNNGNTTTMPQPGALGSSYTAKYDAWNRLVEVSDTGGVVASYEYDGLNRRTIRTENSTTTHFYYNGSWQCLEERVGTATTADKQYVWGVRYIDDLVLSDKGANRYYYCQDANFNVVAALSNTGAVQERYAYTPYGVVEYLTSTFGSSSSSSIGNEFLYTGRRLDPETGLQQSRYRYYHAQLGRFLARDPLNYTDALNLYLYALANPLKYLDPDGMAVFSRRERDCIADCKAGCAAEYGWYNPQRYICSSYCDNACTGTPDIIDRAGDLLDDACSLINSVANNNTLKCACLAANLHDLASSHPITEAADCACNVLTTIQTFCNRGAGSGALYAALSALDCSSAAFAALGCGGGAFIGGIGGVPGAILGCFIGGRIADSFVDLLTEGAENYVQQGSVCPWAEIGACGNLLSGNF